MQSLFSPHQKNPKQNKNPSKSLLQSALRSIKTGAEGQITANIYPGKGTESFKFDRQVNCAFE